MIMPVQRIPRYKLFIGELLKCTWKSHLDYQNLLDAEKKVESIAEAIENQSADAMSIAKVMELASTFVSQGESFKLVVPHRRYIADTDATLLPDNAAAGSTTNLRVFLFNDLILWAKPKKDKFIIRHKMEIAKIEKISFPTSSKSGLFRGSADSGKKKTIGLFEFKMEDLVIRMILLDNEVSEKWAHYVQVCKEGGKVWLPHSSKDVSTKAISAKEDAATPNTRAKKHRIFTLFSSSGKDTEQISKTLKQKPELLLTADGTALHSAVRSQSLEAPSENCVIVQEEIKSHSRPGSATSETEAKPPRKRRRSSSITLTNEASNTTASGGGSGCSFSHLGAGEERSVPLDDDEDQYALYKSKTYKSRKKSGDRKRKRQSIKTLEFSLNNAASNIPGDNVNALNSTSSGTSSISFSISSMAAQKTLNSLSIPTTEAVSSRMNEKDFIPEPARESSSSSRSNMSKSQRTTRKKKRNTVDQNTFESPYKDKPQSEIKIGSLVLPDLANLSSVYSTSVDNLRVKRRKSARNASSTLDRKEKERARPSTSRKKSPKHSSDTSMMHSNANNSIISDIALLTEQLTAAKIDVIDDSGGHSFAECVAVFSNIEKLEGESKDDKGNKLSKSMITKSKTTPKFGSKLTASTATTTMTESGEKMISLSPAKPAELVKSRSIELNDKFRPKLKKSSSQKSETNKNQIQHLDLEAVREKKQADEKLRGTANPKPLLSPTWKYCKAPLSPSLAQKAPIATLISHFSPERNEKL